MNQLFYCWVKTAGQQFAKNILNIQTQNLGSNSQSKQVDFQAFDVYILVSKLYVA